MSAYRYFTTSLIGGQLLADTLPLHVGSFSRGLGGVGQPGRLDATLDLGAVSSTVQTYWLNALEPRKTVLWVLQDNYPVWAGVVWDWAHSSAKSDQLPIVATEIGSLFNRRQVRVDQIYNGVDQFNIIRNLINYALGKTNGGVAQLVHTTNLSGVLVSEPFPASNLGKIMSLVDGICTKYNIEYAFDPGTNPNGQPIITLRIGTLATMGRPYSSTQLQLVYPGNLTDYAWPRTGSAGTNSLIATAGGQGGSAWVSNPATHGLDTADLARGYPLLEDSISYTGSVISAQSGIDAYADGKQLLVAKSPTIPSATIAGGQSPTVQQIQLGDHAAFIGTSSLHPPVGNAPGIVQDVRIIGWTVHPPGDGNAESTDLVLGGVTS